MEVICCGSRFWSNAVRIATVLHDVLPPHSVLIHGGCTGADLTCAIMGERYGHTTREYPAQWQTYGRAAGPIRNQQMLDLHPHVQLVLAFHHRIKCSTGTKDMIQRALRNKIPVRLFTYDRELSYDEFHVQVFS